MRTVSRPAASMTFGFIVAGLVALVGLCGLVPLAAAQPLGSEFRVNTYTTSYQGRPRVAADSTGNFVVVWQSSGQDGSGSGVFGQRYSSSGAPQGPEFRVNTFTTDQEARPAVATDGAGNFVVVWEDFANAFGGRGIIGQRYSSSGAPQGPEFRVNTYTTYFKQYPAVAADGAGNFVVVWGSFVQDGSGTGVFGQRYSSSGAPQGPEFRVNTYTTGDQRSPSVAADAAGNFVVVWQSRYQDGSSNGVFGQRYASSGAPQGPEFRVNTYTTSFQNYPAVAADSTGDFVVVWQSYQDGSATGIFGQRYASSGAPQGAEFRVNTYTTSSQGYPAVATDSTGNFTVVWYSYQEGPGNGFGIFGQRFSSGGVPQGPEFRVNTQAYNTQVFPAVAADSASNFVVVWQSNLQDGSNYGVFGQRFTSVIPPCGNGTPDPGEDCDEGTSNGSPSSCCSASCAFIAAGTECRASAGVCDPAETCTGASGTCPADAKSTAECRAAAGACDVAESCDGVSNNCPANGFKAATVECRASAGVCDPAENCPGNGPNCPGDAKSTALCRPAAAACDAPESCDGVNNDCPADGLQPATFQCRASAGPCDVAEYCTGIGLGCPADTKSTGVCRPAAGVCDVAESCDGASNACPANLFVSDGTGCNDGNVCTSGDQCSGGNCVGAAVADGTSCDDGNSCTSGDQCTGGICGGAARPDIAPCDDGNVCTSGDVCTGGHCSGNAIPDGAPCNDGNVCTSGDHCAGGSCSGTPLPNGTSCNDASGCMSGGHCTAGVCDGSPRPNGTPCNDRNACTSGDQCLGGLCGGAPVPDGTACNDANRCTSGDQCSNGVCDGMSEPDGAACDDANSCTGDDQCAGGVCRGDPVSDGQPCSDRTLCTSGDQCSAGVCSGSPVADGTPCDDGKGCTSGDQCSGGVCGGFPIPDGTACSEACTSGLCDTGVCEGTPSPDGTPCNDAIVCTMNDACTNGVCTGEPSCNDHYLCYKIKPTTTFTPITVNLIDQFETTAADVKKPKDLCPPANKNNEGVIDPVTHEESYPIKAAVKHMSHTNVAVMDQFGTLHVDTVKADRLLVPTNKGLGSTPPPVSGTVDHYTCYKVKITKGMTAFPKDVQATVQTQFDTRLYDVKKPKHLCTPVNKNGEGVTSMIAHLMCYQVKAARGELPHVKVIGTIQTRNQFGTGRLDTIKEDELCVPAQKHP